MKIENIYSSIACNRTTQSVDWGKNNLILFAGCNSINLFDPNYDNGSVKIIKTFVKHTKRVNTVKWIKNFKNDNEIEFISGSDDGSAIVWNIENFEDPKLITLSGHESGINAVEGIYKLTGNLLIATSSADSSIKLWDILDNQVKCLQTILLSTGFCFALSLNFFPNTKNQILLAFASDDDTISLWTNANYDDKFYKIHQFIGHEDWVRCLDIVATKENDLLIASSSQDSFIRLWRISPRSNEQVKLNAIDLLNIAAADEIHVEEKIISIGDDENKIYFACSVESVLQGHDNWVYGVHWHKDYKTGDIELLSSSIDKSLIIWNLTDGVWMEKARLGEVGGNSLGFFGGKFSPDGSSVLGHGFQGSFHIWQKNENSSLWEPKTIIGGHFNEVRDLCWEPKGGFLLTVSADQTTRIHAPWVRSNCKSITWHELARPQVHGYDFQCITVLSRYKFASGAEEKIVRNFQAPSNFIENFRKISAIKNDSEGDELLKMLPKGASVPSLGLSNKAVYNNQLEEDSEKHVKDEYPENYFTPVDFFSPPQEEILMQNTLWPEIQKLYGHGFEIFTLASSTDGKILASSCKAATAEHAEIILWDTKTWKQIQKLASHQLTVTQMKFSPNNIYLLSVSRDRKFTLFENKIENNSYNFEVVYRSDKSSGIHSRIIWSCDWSHDSKFFGTSSRDGKVIIWKYTDNICKALGVLELLNESITAIAFSQGYLNDDEYLVALGFETGKIQLYSFKNEWKLESTINSSIGHHLSVTKLQFRPNYNEIYLASCGDDNFVRINKIIL